MTRVIPIIWTPANTQIWRPRRYSNARKRKIANNAVPMLSVNKKRSNKSCWGSSASKVAITEAIANDTRMKRTRIPAVTNDVTMPANVWKATIELRERALDVRLRIRNPYTNDRSGGIQPSMAVVR
jgi:hypothetical protein